MSITLTIGDTTVSSLSAPELTLLASPQPSVQKILGQTGAARFTVRDASGAHHWTYGTRVTITDSVLGLCFSGYLYDDTETNLPPNLAINHAISCLGKRYLADKRVASGPNDDANMSNKYAGDDVVYLLAHYLASEGVMASYAEQFTSTQDDFATGVLSGVAATANLTDGNLELAPAGTPVSKVVTTTADFNANTAISGIDTTGNQVTLANHSGLKLEAYASSGFNNAFLYQKFWTGTYTIQSTDYLSYKVWIASSSPAIQAAVDGVCSDGTTIRDAGLLDQYALSAHPSTDLSGYANDQWYNRSISLSGLAGKVLSYAQLGFEGNTAGTYTAYFYDIAITDASGNGRQVLYASLGQTHASIVQPAANSKVSSNAYSTASIVPVIVYEQTGTRIGVSTSIAAAGIYKSSFIGWTQVLPTSNTALVVSTSLDQGATYQAATAYQPIPNLLPGVSLVGKSLMVKQVLTLSGTDPTVTPVLSDITWSVQPSYAATKLDTQKIYDSQANWTTGTLTNLTATTSGDLVITNKTRDWMDGLLTNQSLFGSGNPVHNNTQRHCNLAADGSGFADSRLDFAGTWLNFTLALDIQAPPSGCNSGLIYRTTNWDGTANSFGWAAEVSLTQIKLGYGSNTAGTNSYTNATTVSFPGSLTAGDWHTLKLVVNGSSHMVYLDDVLYINITNTTYNSVTGNLALRFFNGSASRNNVYFDNFGVMNLNCTVGSSPAPSWVGPSFSVGSLTVGTSLVQWNTDGLAGDVVSVLAQVNGGGYQACTNNAPLPQLTAGQALTNATVQFKVTMQAATAAETPTVHGLSFWLSSAYSSSGSRISPSLHLGNVGRIGSTLVSWNALQPPGTTLFLDTALDTKTNWVNVGSGASGSAAIAGLTTQADAIDDTFESNTSSYYASTIGTNGTPASWTWGATSVTASGGSDAQLLYSSLSASDIDLITDMDASDAGGLVWRVANSNAFYCLVVGDASSPSPNGATVYRVQNAVYTPLASTTLNWPRLLGIPHRLRVTMIGALITVYFDGGQILQYTDPFPLSKGQVGLRSSTISGASTATFYSLRIQALGESALNRVVFTRERLVSTDPTATVQVQDVTVSVRSPDIGNGAFIPTVAYSVLNGSKNTLSQDLDDLATQSNYLWDISDTNALLFHPLNGTPAPFVLTPLDMLLGFGITVKNTGDAFRTSSWVQGGTDTMVVSKTFPCDGQNQTFTLDYPVDSLVSVTDSGGQSHTFGVKGVDTGKDFYYQQGNNTITQDPTETPLSPTIQLTIVENGQINVVSHAQDNAQVAIQAALEQTSGLIEVVQVAQGLNLAAAHQFADSDLAKNGQFSRVLTCTTARAGLAIGQILPVFLPQHALVDVQMLITALQISWRLDAMRGGGVDATPYITLTAASGPVLNAWAMTIGQGGR